MFGDVDKTAASKIMEPSALERGILRPKQDAQTDRPDIYAVKEPVFARGLITVLAIVVILGVAGGGGWFVYNKFIKQGEIQTAPEAQIVVEQIVEEAIPALVEEQAVSVEETPAEGFAEADVASDVKDQQALFGEPIDKDGDGLDDDKETEIGTDPNNWDTDGDELSDGDEALVWKTDPLNPDTDSDKYTDGMEVKSGYNPNGPGKIFEPPK